MILMQNLLKFSKLYMEKVEKRQFLLKIRKTILLKITRILHTLLNRYLAYQMKIKLLQKQI